MIVQPTLMLCVGATKSGTSWLFQYLSEHPQCYLRSVKELHFFDTMGTSGAKKSAERHVALAEALGAKLDTAPATRFPDLLRRLGDHSAVADLLREGDPDQYLSYLMDGRGDQRLVGEVTPAYGLLPVPDLTTIASLLPDVRIIYLMRDPVERLWSHIRMTAARRSMRGQITRPECRRILRRLCAGGEADIAIRSDYRGAIERLRAAVPSDRLLLTYYENMFAQAAPTQVCAFLGIDPLASDRQTLIHAGKEVQMPFRMWRVARNWLAPQYDFVAQAVGDVPPAWQMDEQGART